MTSSFPEITETIVRQVLSQIIDPEVGASIVELGLIYGIHIRPHEVTIDMTMTSPACPMGEMILDDIDQTLRHYLPAGVRSTVHLVWDPPWDPSKMSPALRQRFQLDDPDHINGRDPDKFLT